VCYEAFNTFRLCGISTSLVHGFIDLERSEPLRRKLGNTGGKIRLSSIVKRCNLTWKVPMRTPKVCKILQQLWHLVENHTFNFIQMQVNHSEQETLDMQDMMVKEFQDPVITQIQEAPSRKLVKVISLALQIQTSPLKILRIPKNNEAEQIALFNSVQKKCRLDQKQSNFPNSCIINGEEYTIQAIIASPIKKPTDSVL